MDWPKAFALTCASEAAFVLFAWWRLGWLGSNRWLRGVLVALGVQLTQPIVWVVTAAGGARTLVGAELGAVLVEGLAAAWLLGRSAGSPTEAGSAAPKASTDSQTPVVGWALLVALGSNALSFALGLAAAAAMG